MLSQQYSTQKKNKVLKCIPAKELGTVERNGTPFILIDDVGTESIKIHWGNKIDAVADAISYAEDNSMTLMLSTNLTPKELTERYDERMIDRLRRCTVVTFDGESLRAKQSL